MADIKCPNCGTMNQVGQDACRNCQTRLDVSTLPLQPGQVPTKKTTAELEPILPQWLRDARDQARKSAQEDVDSALNQPEGKKELPVDLLAGLQAQAGDEDEEVPDWLSTITGKSGKGKKAGREESTEVRWVELGGGTKELSEPASKKKDSIPVGQAPVPTSGDNELPPWLANVIAGQEDSKQDTLSGYLKNTDAGDLVLDPPDKTAGKQVESAARGDKPFPRFEKPFGEDANAERSTRPSVEQSPAVRRPEGFAPLEAGLPDWMKTQPLGPGPSQPASEELPNWLKNLDNPPAQAEMNSFEENNQQVFSPADSSDPLGNLGGIESIPASKPPSPFSSGIAPGVETPDWLRNMGADAAAPATSASNYSPDSYASPQGEFGAELSETPDWLKNLGSEEPATPATDSGAPVEAAGLTGLSESPDWLKNLGSDEPATPATDSGAPADAGLTGLSESPDWLNNLGAQEPATSTSELPEPAGGISFSETPDWLKDLGGAPSPDTPADLPPSPAFMTPELSQSALPAFAPEGGQNVFPADSLSRNDMESLFTEMPDWLAGVATEEPGLSSAPADQNVIAPGSLPSWVEAMRPVESSVAQGGAAGDQTLETRGPLAGLHGVLPAVPFPGPSSKPKVHSIKLVASEEQQAHAALLEEVLGAETIPVPIVSQRQVASQRVLRLATAILLFALIPAFVFGGTQIFPLPASRNITPEVQAGFDSIWVIPESAPVLVVFDYDPALAGEMETLAAPFMDQIILLKHPRLTFLSTSPVGPALAENFFSGLQRQIGNYEGYEPGIGYINLGYLPGGLSGVRAFVQNPLISAPLAFDGSQPWQSEALKDVQAFPHFAEIIVLTDSAESGRTWIEQTELLRGASPLVILASAQAGPLLAPYFESGQVNLLFTGLHDSVLLEQIDAGRPGTARRYWDAYNIGLLFAVVFILGGSLLSFIAGLRERAEARAG